MSTVRFLIADNSLALQTFAKNLISGYGFDANWVQIAPNPDAAMASAREWTPHFLLTDCFSQHASSGVELVKAIQEMRPAVRWALMSDKKDETLANQARELGAMFQLVKPFTAPDIKAAMHKALTEWGQENKEVAARLQTKPVAPARNPNHFVSELRVVPVRQLMPAMTTLKVGDQVVYRGRRDTVRHVIFRKGELMVQLTEAQGIMPADKVRRV